MLHSRRSRVFFPQFIYDNGVGSAADRFDINLYRADDDIDYAEHVCGTKVATLCDKPDIGCRDSGEMCGCSEESGVLVHRCSLVDSDQGSSPPSV